MALGALTACGSFSSSEDDLDKNSNTDVESFAVQRAAPPSLPLGTQVDCPPIKGLPETHLLVKYQRGKEGDPTALVYQANIEKSANTCRVAAGGISMKVGIAGHVTPGPVWRGGSIDLPVRVAVVEDNTAKKAIFSKRLKADTNLPAGSPSHAWAVVEENIFIPRSRGYEVLYGFDEN
ncbi:hypothetical protein [Flexibacterium corallicola]|uniref:hypothetical protein n=1 Tax=Flexibacterium corallicola TaxID=3037259 RepID=UPI00286F86E0|nr:hypothetical protein [Pseudovibrio sp. M1P-2-3]